MDKVKQKTSAIKTREPSPTYAKQIVKTSFAFPSGAIVEEVARTISTKPVEIIVEESINNSICSEQMATKPHNILAIKEKTKRKMAERKDPEEEFFNLTLLSNIMTNEKKNVLISILSDSAKLFKQCQKTGKQFYEWNAWI